MGYSIKKNTKIAIERETTQGTYVAPTAGASFIQVKEDGLEMTPGKELLERNILGLGLSKVTPRTGLRSVTGALPVEMKAGSTEGAQPEYGLMLESLLGTVKETASQVSGSSHTTTTIFVSDTSGYEVGDVVLIKEAGAYHKSPIASLVTDTSIELLVEMDSAPADGVEIAALCTYKGADDGHPAYSATKYVEDAVRETATGCLTTSMSVDNFTTGQLADLSFGFEGLDFARSLSAPAYTPSFDSSEPPIILKACIFVDGEEVEVNEFTLSVENTIGFIQDTCNGKTASRITDRAVSGTINPYKLDDNIDNFNRFNENTTFSLFVTAHTPTGTTGEFKETFSFYLPVCIITEISETDLDGVLQESLSFTAGSVDGSVSDIFISMS